MATGNELRCLMIDVDRDICCLGVHARSVVARPDGPDSYEP